MGPKFPAANLRDVRPTQEEIEGARMVIANASDKERKAKQAQMSHFLKSNPDPEVLNSRGKTREAWLELYLAHSMRSTAATKKVQSEKTSETSTSHTHRVFEWAKEEMDKDMGAHKAAAWRECGKLKTNPCP